MDQPGRPTLLWRGLTRACPRCGNRRGVFRHWLIMAEACPRCGLRFERQPGHFIGGVTINTVFTFSLGFVAMIAWLVLSWPDPNPWIGLLVLLPVGMIFPVLFFPVSKTLWTAIDMAMRPLERHEIDP